MVKEKGPGSAAEYTKFIRQRANVKLSIDDTNNSTPMASRKGIISNSPQADIARSFLSRFSRRDRREYITGWDVVQILHPTAKTGYTFGGNTFNAIGGGGGAVIIGNNLFFVCAASNQSSVSYSIILRVPLNGSPANVCYATPNPSDNTLPPLTSLATRNGVLYVSSDNGNIYTANFSGDMLTITSLTIFVNTANLGNQVRAIAFDSAGNMYAGRYGAGVISKISPDGTVLDNNWAIGNAGVSFNLQAIQSVCAIIQGIEYLYIGSITPGRVVRIPLNNKSNVQIVSDSTGPSRSVAADKYGNIYIGCAEGVNLQKFLDIETGNLITILGTGVSNDASSAGNIGTQTSISQPRGIAIDDNTKTGYFISTDGAVRSMKYIVGYKESGIYI